MFRRFTKGAGTVNSPPSGVVIPDNRSIGTPKTNIVGSAWPDWGWHALDCSA